MSRKEPQLRSTTTPTWVPDVRVERLLDASHWVQQDSLHKVNALLLEFLRTPGVGTVRETQTSRRTT